MLSTRIRLARNLEGFAFPGRAREGERLRVLARVREATAGSASLANGVLVRVDELPPEERLLLHERHLVSRELAGLDPQHPMRSGAAVFLGDGTGVMVNEEDHLRLQALRSGFDLAGAYTAIRALDDELGARVPYAFHQEFGFLTSCPTNTGTGMRASVLMHLPGLVLTKEIAKTLTGLQQLGLTYRGLYGEGSEVVGNFFQISNQTTLGRSEDEIIEQLTYVLRTVVAREEDARRVLLRDAGYIIEDKLWRAYGTLAVRPQPVVRRGDELSQRCQAGRRVETCDRSECLYSQQAPDLFPVGAPGTAGGTVAHRGRCEPGSREVRAAGVGRRIGDHWVTHSPGAQH